MFSLISFQAYPAIVEDLDLIDEEDQVTHMMTLEDAVDPENGLSEWGGGHLMMRHYTGYTLC